MKQHSSRFIDLVNQAKSHIQEITPENLKQKMDHKEPLILIDVREDSEWTTGHIPHAIHMGKGIIERDIEKQIPDVTTPIVVYCSGGFRCALVAESLKKMGYTNVQSLSSGLGGWINAGFPLQKV